jgi:integrin-linked kinase-associated serine/threonine phosphatase 2C
MGVAQSDGKKKEKTKNKIDDEEKEDNSSMLIFADCINGKKKKNDMTGQDTNDIITKELGENIKFFGVYDGHGTKGREASLMLKYEIRKKLIKDKSKVQRFIKKEQVEKYFRDLFRNIQKKYDNRSNDYELSGSCAICVLILDYKIYSINLGDSRAVLGSKKSNKKIALEMSIDHKPTRDDEMKRINERGGEVSDKISGVSRVFKKNDELPGLAVSRSLGDIVAHECGVVSEPEIIEKEIEPDDFFIVIGSDGIWDAMSSTEVVGFIFDKMDNKKELVSKMLVEECRNRWEIINLYKQKYLLELVQSKESESQNKTKDNYQNVLDIDDITAVIHFFNYDY